MRQPRQFFVSLDDVDLAVTEWSGEGDPILLLHATGFHSRCWDQVVRHLPNQPIYAVDLRFHGASGDSGEVSWGLLSRDIAQLVDALNLRNITGAGHSIGGHVLARAAASKLDHFKRLVLIDPVIMPPARYAMFDELGEDMDPASHPVNKRKNNWHDAEEMFARFADKKPFSTWDPAVLRDYTNYALKPADSNGVRQLACDPANEAKVYFNQKGNSIIYRELPGLNIPITLLRVAPSEDEGRDPLASPTWPELAQLLPDCEEVYLPHMNHFIPMQDPKLVADYIQRGD